jgi:hypothetical protein
MRVVESRCGAGFAAEPRLEVWVLCVVGQQHLQRHHAVDGGVVGLPHLTHPAAAQQLNQLVAAKRRALHRLTINLSATAVMAESNTTTNFRCRMPDIRFRVPDLPVRLIVSLNRTLPGGLMDARPVGRVPTGPR